MIAGPRSSRCILSRPACGNGRRGLRRLTSDVSEHDLRAIAERGYECAVSNDDVEQAQAVGLFLSDALLQL
jgi:hypothetical protein